MFSILRGPVVGKTYVFFLCFFVFPKNEKNPSVFSGSTNMRSRVSVFAIADGKKKTFHQKNTPKDESVQIWKKTASKKLWKL